MAEIKFEESFIENSPTTRSVIRKYIIRHNLMPYVCEKCGNEFSAVNKKTRYCPDCVPAVKAEQWQRRREQMNRPCTADTEFLICVYTYRGDSISRIAADLNRSKDNVEKILDKAKGSGSYDRHIKIYEMRGV